jgi:2-polyprenyl-3-methyl-5-hydroxy-6-metoxy-1,4-benzoquinol methylase
MNWHDTIISIQKSDIHKDLVLDTFISPDINLNIKRYSESQEFKEIRKIIFKIYRGKKIKILDVGAGNGISSIALAKEGHYVTALEPDNSNLVGSQAIQFGANTNKVKIEIIETYFEDLPEKFFNSFDLVFARQAMHHANSLNKFILSANKALTHGGYLFTVRDHVISNEFQKKIFLKKHPLHKFYGGENAYTLKEYLKSFSINSFELEKIYRPNSTPINYHPWSIERVKRRLPFFLKNIIISKIIFSILKFRMNFQPGRLYSFILIKVS